MDTLIDTLLKSPYFLLFLIIAIGLALGRIKIQGVSLESSAVIFVALLLGHLGYTLPDVVQQIGLVFFIFTIGMQAGPGFFQSFMKEGRKLIVVAGVIILTAAITAWVASRVWGLDKNLVLGIFNGALTSTPGLAAASEISGNSPLAPIGYSIAYPLGVILVIMFLQFVPALLRINFRKCEHEHEQEQHEHIDQIISENIKINNINIDGKTIVELHLRSITGCVISRIKHEGITTTPTKSTVLHVGDVVKVVGTAEELTKAEYFLGQSIDEDLSLQASHTVEWILITNKQVINKPLYKMNLFGNFDTTIIRIRRSGIDLAPDGNMTLRFGDRVLIACSKDNIEQVAKVLGNDNKRLSSTDFLPIALGILLGVIVGRLTIPIAGIEIGLGVTGGVLAAALVLSAIGKTGPIIWSMSSNANQIFRELGLLLFLAGVGTSAGKDIAGAMGVHGITPLLVGIAVTLLPMVMALIVGRYMLKLNFITLLGVIAGGMTSTPGLSAVTSKSETSIAQIAYATVYPFALVLMIIFSTLLYYV